MDSFDSRPLSAAAAPAGARQEQTRQEESVADVLLVHRVQRLRDRRKERVGQPRGLLRTTPQPIQLGVRPPGRP